MRSLPNVGMTEWAARDDTKTIRLLIKKPADVFIGEARENQLPISFRENSCNSWAKLFLFIPMRSLPNVGMTEGAARDDKKWGKG